MAPPRNMVIFHSSCQPPLGAGDYRLKVGHQLVKGTTRVDSGSRPLPPEQVHNFTITGPRFSLDPGEIHAAYPPQNSRGTFARRLPMIVLRRRTLPWERPIDGAALAAAAAPAPWMALLLFEEQEVTLLDPPTSTVGYIVNADRVPNIEGPVLIPAPTNDELALPVAGIEVPLSKFAEVAPTEEELRFLTHVREVNTEDKELLGMDEDGWFSVVVGNRLPEEGKKYVACLVSLEGCRVYLPTATSTRHLTVRGARALRVAEGRQAERERRRAAADRRGRVDRPGLPVAVTTPTLVTRVPIATTGPVRRIRLIALARWRFECKPGGDFGEIIQAIVTNNQVAMFPEVSPTPSAIGVIRPPNPLAIDTGHIPLPATTRLGESVTVWYRGPLVPTTVARDPAGPYHTADQARRVDPDTGMENVGYAAAFEIGRLLALADPVFAIELLRWRRAGYRTMVKGFVQRTFEGRIPHLREFVDFSILPTRLVDVLGLGIRESLWLGPLRDPLGFDPIRQRMPGLDPQSIAAALGLTQNVVTGFMRGSLPGDGPILDRLGLGSGGIRPDLGGGVRPDIGTVVGTGPGIAVGPGVAVGVGVRPDSGVAVRPEIMTGVGLRPDVTMGTGRPAITPGTGRLPRAAEKRRARGATDDLRHLRAARAALIEGSSQKGGR